MYLWMFEASVFVWNQELIIEMCFLLHAPEIANVVKMKG